MLGLVLAITVATPTFTRGGFDSFSRSLFVVFAGVALLVTARVDERSVIEAARSPVALTLFAVAGLSLASAGWTVGSRTAALRWGLVVGGYAAVFIVAATVTRAYGPWPIAAGVAVIATIEAVLGLQAVAFHALPDAEQVDAIWRPGGTFEYTPALAILEVGALPIFTCAAARCNQTIAGIAAAAALMAGAVLGLTGSRLAPTCAVVLLLVLIARPPAGSAGRAAAMATAAFVVIGALLAPVVLRGDIRVHAQASGVRGIAEIVGLAAAAGIAWTAANRLTGSTKRAAIAASVCTAAVLLAAIASVTERQDSYSTSRTLRRPPVRSYHQSARQFPASHRLVLPNLPTDRSVLHGRGYQWKAAIETWLDHPIFGAGADAYFVASIRHQTGARTLFAHNLPLELAAELGVLGLLLGLALYGSTAWTIFRTPTGDPRWLLMPTVALLMVANLFDWSWHLAGLGAIWAATSGALKIAAES
jgi:O-Antigen ligase